MKKYKVLIIIFSIMVLSIFLGNVEASNLNLNHLKFDAVLDDSGNMKVTEIWDISVGNTNTLYKIFDLNEKFDGFSNASVYEVLSTGEKVPFYKTDVEVYHVDKGSYYSLINSKNMYEIAWGVSIGKLENRTYEINYTVDNIIQKYNDCEELYWQFIGKEFEIPADRVDGVITLPENAHSMEDIRVWAHGPLNGNISKVSNNKFEFSVDNFKSQTMLEIRVVTPSGLFSNSNKTINTSKLEDIIAEETIWADEANARRRKYEKAKEKEEKVVIEISFISVIVASLIVIKYIKTLKETTKKNPEMELDYYREIPGGDDSVPTDAAFFQGCMNTCIPNIISALMLDLALKKYMEFEIIDNGSSKKDILVRLKSGKEDLKEEEILLYNYLLKIAKNDNSFTMKKLEEYLQTHIYSFNKMADKIIDATQKRQLEKGMYDKQNEKKKTVYSFFKVLYFIISILFGIGAWVESLSCDKWYLFLIPTILFFILVCLTSIIASRYSYLTQEGINEKEKWDGLKKYMKDFSLLNEKEVPALVLWEEYLVYATAFGIAEKVLKQLKIKYPEISNPDALNGTTYMYLMYNNGLSDSFISSINGSISTSYYTGNHSSSNYSSGSGAGGGFSCGGRRWLWRWRRRRSLK